MAELDPAQIAAWATQLRTLKTGAAIIAFRRGLTKEQARAVIKHPSISPVERGAIILAVQFQGEQRIRDRFHWSPDWGFGDSLISSQDISDGSEPAANRPAQEDQRSSPDDSRPAPQDHQGH